MTKDEALKAAAKMLSKLMESDNADIDRINCQAYILTAEADKDYGKAYVALEDLKHFISKLQNALKGK